MIYLMISVHVCMLGVIYDFSTFVYMPEVKGYVDHALLKEAMTMKIILKKYLPQIFLVLSRTKAQSAAEFLAPLVKLSRRRLVGNQFYLRLKGSRTLEDLERFCIEECAQITCYALYALSNLIEHGRRVGARTKARTKTTKCWRASYCDGCVESGFST